MIDIDTVVHLLKVSDGSNPNHDDRKRAVELLSFIKKKSGYATALMSIWQSEREDDIRLKATILFKNDADLLWTGAWRRGASDEEVKEKVEEKEMCKKLLLDSFAKEKNELVVRQLSQCIAKLARIEMRASKGWTELFPTLTRLISDTAAGMRPVMTGLLVVSDSLRELSSARMLHFQSYFDALVIHLLPPLTLLWNKSFKSLTNHFKDLFRAANPSEALKMAAQLKQNLTLCGYLNESIRLVCVKASQVSMDSSSPLGGHLKALCAVLSQLSRFVWPTLDSLRAKMDTTGTHSAAIEQLSEQLAECISALHSNASELHSTFTIPFRHVLSDYLTYAMLCVTSRSERRKALAKSSAVSSSSAESSGRVAPPIYESAVVFGALFLRDVLAASTYRGKPTSSMTFGRGKGVAFDIDGANECKMLFEGFFSETRMRALCDALVCDLVWYTPEDVAHLCEEPCDFYHESTIEKKESNVRSAAKCLLSLLARSRREVCAPLIVSKLMAVTSEPLTASTSTHTLLRREAMHLVFGLAYFTLHKALDESGFKFEHFFERILLRDLKACDSLLSGATLGSAALLKARLAWLFGRLSDGITDESRGGKYQPIAYRIVLGLMAPFSPPKMVGSGAAIDEDSADAIRNAHLLVRIQATRALLRLTAVSNFNSEAFCRNGCLRSAARLIIEAVGDCRASLPVMAQLMKCLSDLVRHCKAAIRTHGVHFEDEDAEDSKDLSSRGTEAESSSALSGALPSSLLSLLPSVWCACSGPDTNLLRRTVVELLTQTVQLLDTATVHKLYALAMPMLEYCTDIGATDDRLFLVEPGLQLWRALLASSSRLTPEMDALFAERWMRAMQEYSENFADLLAVAKSYLLIGSTPFVTKHGSELCQTLHSAVSDEMECVLNDERAFETLVVLLCTLVRLYPDNATLFVTPLTSMCLRNFLEAVGSGAQTVSRELLETHMVFYSRLLIENRAHFHDSVLKIESQVSSPVFEPFVKCFLNGSKLVKIAFKQRIVVFGYLRLISLLCERKFAPEMVGSVLDACVPYVFKYVDEMEADDLGILMMDQNEVDVSDENSEQMNETDRVTVLNSKDATACQFALTVLRDTLTQASDYLGLPLEALLKRLSDNSSAPLAKLFEKFRVKYMEYRTSL